MASYDITNVDTKTGKMKPKAKATDSQKTMQRVPPRTQDNTNSFHPAVAPIQQKQKATVSEVTREAITATRRREAEAGL